MISVTMKGRKGHMKKQVNLTGEHLKVIHIIDDYRIAISAGSSSGIEQGQRFLLYCLSKDLICDPDTGKPIDYLEIVKGTGVVTYVQEKMSIIESDIYQGSTKTIEYKTTIGDITFCKNLVENIKCKIHVPFNGIEINDLVKRIN